MGSLPRSLMTRRSICRHISVEHALRHWIETHPNSGSRGCGDFAAHIELSRQTHVFVVGDIAGHGDIANAAAKALRSYVCEIVESAAAPACVLDRSFSWFRRNLLTDATPTASVFVARVHEHTNTIRYASAGHEPAVLFGRCGSHVHLAPTGPVFGIPTDAVFGQIEHTVPDRSVLVVCTDGITEARPKASATSEFFGSRGVVNAIRSATHAETNPAVAVYHAALRHCGGEMIDDATVLVAQMSLDTNPIGMTLHNGNTIVKGSASSDQTPRRSGRAL